MAEPRVTDDYDDAGGFVWEGFGPISRTAPPERRRIQTFMQRVARDVQANPGDYGPLRDPLILLVENYARTVATEAELARRMDADARAADLRGAAATLLRRVWQAQQEADRAG